MRGWAGRPPKRPTRLFGQLPSPAFGGPTSRAERARAWGEDAVSRAGSHPPPLLLGACHPSNVWAGERPWGLASIFAGEHSRWGIHFLTETMSRLPQDPLAVVFWEVCTLSPHY